MDRMLSEDSCALVEEHLESCVACRNFSEELKRESHSLECIGDREKVDAEAKTALKGIRRSIFRKRVVSVCVAVVCVLAAVRVGYYFYAEHQAYISYEDSGLVMQGDKLYATKTYYGRMSSLISPDQTVEFIQMQETAEVKKVYPAEDCYELICDYGDQLDPAEQTYENEDKISGIEKVYYLPAEYVNYRFNFDDAEIGAAQTKELEENSILLWEKSANA
jgi:hypothetical protein